MSGLAAMWQGMERQTGCSCLRLLICRFAGTLGDEITSFADISALEGRSSGGGEGAKKRKRTSTPGKKKKGGKKRKFH